MDACGLCGGPAEYAVHALISTRRARPRRQKCSRAAVFCGACIRASAPGCETPIPTVLLQCFWDAYTSVNDVPDTRAEETVSSGAWLK